MIEAAERYLRSRSGCYAWRALRYRAAAGALVEMGLDDDSLLVDVGAGWTEFDFCLRSEFRWRGRYHPVDAMLDGTDPEGGQTPTGSLLGLGAEGVSPQRRQDRSGLADTAQPRLRV